MMAREEDLAPDIRKDIQDYDDYKTFEDAYHTHEEGTTIKGFHFFNAQDSVLRPFLGVGKPTAKWFDWIWRTMNVQLLFLSSAIWETLLAFMSTTGHSKSRRKRRQKRQRTIYIFPATWMVLTGCIMISKHMIHNPDSGEHPLNPIFNGKLKLEVKQRLHTTYQRVEQLNELVDINPSVFGQYQRIRFSELQAAILAKQQTRTKLNIVQTGTTTNP